MKKIFQLLIIATLITSIAACKNKGKEDPIGENDIVIGAVLSLTGSEATFGTSTREGMNLAIEKINAAGGINGKKLRAIYLDDQGRPDEAANVTTKLITQNKVMAVLGEVASSISLAMAPIAQNNKVPMITPSSTNPKVTQVGDYIFRVCFIDPFQGAVMAKFSYSTLKFKNVAVLRDIKNDYSVGLANFFTQTFKELGGTIVIDQSYSAGDLDFKSQLTAIKSKNPEAIFLPGYYTDVGLIARQARELGITVPFLGGDGWDSTKLIEIGGNSLEGSYFSNHYSPDDQSPEIQAFISEYKAKYNKIPDSMAVTGYDAVLVLTEALKKSPNLTHKELRDALAQTKDVKAVSGNITLNEKRDAVKPAVVLEIKDGKFVFKEKISP